LIATAQSRARFATLDEWLVWLEALHPKKIDLGLDRITAVLRRLELAQPPFAVVTVGGTNGKGSCVALLEAIYRAAGYTVGAYTSPHLWRFNERIRCDGEDADDSELIALFELIEDARGEVSLSYFETATVAALLHFLQRKVDVAILEVGLGGRLDAVNAVDADAALIASVDIDHVQWLGADRDSIGYEKAGIARRGRPLVVGDRCPPLGLLRELARLDAKTLRIDIDFRAEPGATTDFWRYIEPGAPERAWPRPAFGTNEQMQNAAACVTLVESLAERLPVAAAAMAAGLRTARLAGRFERHRRAEVEWIFDIAHNPAAARVLAGALAELPPARREVAVIGLMRDKDAEGVLEPLLPRVDAWHVATLAADRAASASDLAGVLEAKGARKVSLHEDAATACDGAAAEAAPAERVLVFGSFYLVGPVMQRLALYSPLSNRDD
jgi:dihydrofolate synthase/folylpolyglutamate synthase